MKNVVGASMLVVAGLLFIQFVQVTPDAGNTQTLRFARKVNLALRRTAHLLLTETGDSTSRILPVHQVNAATFLIRLDRPFKYGRLPALLQQSFNRQGIHTDYDVVILDCDRGEVQLSYSVQDLLKGNDIACVKREQKPGCYTLQVAFAEPTTQGPSSSDGWVWLAGVLLLGGAYVFWQKKVQATHPPTIDTPPVAVSDNQIQVGQVVFNDDRQSVRVAGVEYTLTYREAKLLNLFVRHPNQVLERDFILKSVWEDEGVIVGRSIDVFVSRLRKRLQPDPTVRLVTIHGVGYRLESTPV